MNRIIEETPSQNQETTLQSPSTRWTLFAHKGRTITLLLFALLAILYVGARPTTVSGQTTISAVSSPFSLKQVNGHKVVATTAGLSAVFADGTTVKYSTSTNGGSWSAPILIANNASEPTVAVAGNIIGIAYVQSGWIYYRYKPTVGGNWSTAVQIQPIGGSEPAMVGYGSTMYLTWESGGGISFTSFPANSPANAAAAWEGVNPLLLCGTTQTAEPAIAVIPASSSSSLPLIRIAYFYQWFRDFSCPAQPAFVSGFIVSEKRPPNQLLFSQAYPAIGSGNNPSNTGGVSMAMAANRSTGEFYVALSEVNNGVGGTSLVYQNAWKNGPWRNAGLLARKSVVDVAAASCSKFRIAVSDFTMGNGTYGPTWYRTGDWSGQNLTWAEPNNVQLSPHARDPQALFWTGNFGLASHRMVHGMYDEQVGTAYFVRHDAFVFSGLPKQDCRIRNMRDEKQDVLGDDVDSH
jgi:hypothetical protein